VVELGKIPGVTVTGGVPSVDPYYENAQVVICPIRYGSGTRIKILEAMANERPVVSTTIGCEGIQVTEGQDILIGDDPLAFANACVSLLKDRGLWSRIASGGRVLVEEKYSSAGVCNTAADLLAGKEKAAA
jgi:glycosyltransferase involved in cell wall biosynthesis